MTTLLLLPRWHLLDSYFILDSWSRRWKGGSYHGSGQGWSNGSNPISLARHHTESQVRIGKTSWPVQSHPTNQNITLVFGSFHDFFLSWEVIDLKIRENKKKNLNFRFQAEPHDPILRLHPCVTKEPQWSQNHDRCKEKLEDESFDYRKRSR